MPLQRREREIKREIEGEGEFDMDASKSRRLSDELPSPEDIEEKKRVRMRTIFW